MNRISRPSAAEAAEALLEAGRTEPVLQYDIEQGLARHHHWLRSEAPVPEWANASIGTAANAWVTVVVKTIVSSVLLGVITVVAWQAREQPQPSAASPDAERTPAVTPGSRGGNVAAPEAWLAHTPVPVPVPDQGVPGDQPAHRAERATRIQRPQKDARTRQANGTAARPSEPASTAAAATPWSEHVTEERAPRHVAAERKPTGASHDAHPEPEPRAQLPDDSDEMRQVATAEQLLERSPERALALVLQGDQRFARGYFRQERAYIAIMALIGLGRVDEARARAASFAKQFPVRPYGVRIRSALAAREAAP